MRFRAKRGVVYTTLSERASADTIGVYMKNNEYRHFYWAGVIDRKVATFIRAKWVKLIMSEYTTDLDPERATWHKIGEGQVLLGCALPSTYMEFVVFAVIEDNRPIILNVASGKRDSR